jgi:hypothetical protein
MLPEGHIFIKNRLLGYIGISFVFAFEYNRPVHMAEKTKERFYGRAFARSVRTDQAYQLACFYRKRDIADDGLAFFIPCIPDVYA